MTRWHGDMSSLQYSYHISPLWHVTSLKPSSFFWRDNHGPQMARSHGNEAVYGPAGHCRADDLTTWSSPRIDVFLLVKNPEFRYVSEGFNYFNGCFWQIENSWVSGANSILFFLGCSPPKRGRPKHQKNESVVPFVLWTKGLSTFGKTQLAVPGFHQTDSVLEADLDHWNRKSQKRWEKIHVFSHLRFLADLPFNSGVVCFRYLCEIIWNNIH